MRFRLMDMSGRKMVHEGVMPRQDAPPAVTWGNRAFFKAHEARAATVDGGEVTATYQEVDAFRIGGAFGG